MNLNKLTDEEYSRAYQLYQQRNWQSLIKFLKARNIQFGTTCHACIIGKLMSYFRNKKNE